MTNPKNIFDKEKKNYEFMQLFCLYRDSISLSTFSFSSIGLTIYSSHIDLLGLLQSCFHDSYGNFLATLGGE